MFNAMTFLVKCIKIYSNMPIILIIKEIIAFIKESNVLMVALNNYLILNYLLILRKYPVGNKEY